MRGACFDYFIIASRHFVWSCNKNFKLCSKGILVKNVIRVVKQHFRKLLTLETIHEKQLPRDHAKKGNWSATELLQSCIPGPRKFTWSAWCRKWFKKKKAAYSAENDWLTRVHWWLLHCDRGSCFGVLWSMESVESLFKEFFLQSWILGDKGTVDFKALSQFCCISDSLLALDLDLCCVSAPSGWMYWEAACVQSGTLQVLWPLDKVSQ